MSAAVHKACEWAYKGVWGGLAEYLRVPKEAPSLPVRTGDRMDSFRPADGFLRYLKLWFWIACLLIDLALLALWIVIAVNAAWWVTLLVTPVFLLVMIVPDIFAYLAVHLRYDTTWYVMTGRSLRIRRGIWVIHETTITFENIQNVKVTQGPVQRYFGISDIVVETAGSGGGGGGGGKQQAGATANQGRIEGVANAAELRDLILAKMRQSKTTGLGDEDETRPRKKEPRGSRGWTPAHLDALREIHAEVAAMAGGAPSS